MNTSLFWCATRCPRVHAHAHCSRRLHFENKEFIREIHEEDNDELPVPSELFFEVFPFNIVFNRGLRIINIGSGIQNVMPELEGLVLSDPFTLIRPLMDFTWDAVCGLAPPASALSTHTYTHPHSVHLAVRAQIIMHANNVFEMVALYEVGHFDEFRQTYCKRPKDMPTGELCTYA